MKKIQIHPGTIKLVAEYIKKTKVRKDFTFHVYYIIHLIHNKPYVDRRFTTECFVPLKIEILREQVSKKELSSILNFLLSSGIIECDCYYIKGEKSFGYRIASEYRGKGWKEIEIKDKKLTEKLMEKEKQIEITIENAGRGYQIVNYWLQELKIDVKKALKYNSNHYGSYSEKYNANIYSINLMHNKKFAVVDKTANRFHNNLTNLPSAFRKFLTIDGNSLYQVDIANSQLFFLSEIIKKYNEVCKKEIKLLSEITSDGQFYEYMAKESGLDIDLTNEEIRTTYKKGYFANFLFSKNRKSLSIQEKTFKTIFPTIYKVIFDIKAKDYKQLAIMLQKEESNFIFKCITEIESETRHLNIPLLTIHDSIVSTEEGIGEVYSIMKTKLEKMYGVSPLLKVSSFK